MRGALAADAQRPAGALPTAEPFPRTSIATRTRPGSASLLPVIESGFRD